MDFLRPELDEQTPAQGSTNLCPHRSTIRQEPLECGGSLA